MHKVTIYKTVYNLPSRWEELTAAQLKKMAWLTTLKKEPANIAKLIVMVMSMSLPWWKRYKFQFFYLISSTFEEKADFVFLTKSFTEYRELSTQKMPKLRVSFVLLYGPDSGLSNCTFWEYIKAEQYFNNYNTSKATAWLDKLVAVLYRPKRANYNKLTDSDIRTPLNDMAVRFRLAAIGKVPMNTKLAILLWFDGCRNSLTKMFPIIFQKVPEDKIALTRSRGSSEWINLISELSTSMTEYEKIGNTPLFTAMMDISHRIKTAKEQKAKQR